LEAPAKLIQLLFIVSLAGMGSEEGFFKAKYSQSLSIMVRFHLWILF